MRRSAFAVTLLGVVLFATAPQAAKRLPEQTTLPEFAAFLQKTVGNTNATEGDGRYLSTIGDIADTTGSDAASSAASARRCGVVRVAVAAPPLPAADAAASIMVRASNWAIVQRPCGRG